MNICIISSIGKQTYQGKFSEIKSERHDFWDLAIFDNEQPLDVVDFYLKETKNTTHFDPNRHIYMNGILLANRLSSKEYKITIMNSLDNNYNFDGMDIVIISTNYVTAQWEEHLINILIKLNQKGIKCIIGGIGIKKIYEKDKEHFDKFSQLINGYIIISDNGISEIKNVLNNLFLPIKNKVIEVDDEYDFKYMDYSLEHIASSQHSKHTALITQTGCIYDCTFCSYKEKSRKHSFFDINEIKKAIVELNRTNINGLNHIRFADETFNIDNSRVIDLCNFIKEKKFTFRWSCFLRANNITDELIYALSDSGCDFVSIGVETGSEFLQNLMNKNIDLTRLKQSIIRLSNAGIVVNISLLVGFFGENSSTIQQTMDFIVESKPDLARINIWNPVWNEKKQNLFKDYNFHKIGHTWYHKTASELDAVSYAKKIYLMDSDTAFIPPFSSIFDQWPVLSSYGLSQKEILEIFKKYYIISKRNFRTNENKP